MKSRLLFALFILSSFTSFSQQYIPYYNTVSSQVSSSNVLNYLTEFENLGVKRRGTTSLQNTLDWLKNKYTTFGYTAAQMKEFSFTNGSFTCKNLVITKTGTLYPNTFVIICGHYDTITGKGTNDNGSGVSTIFEVARLLQNIPTEYSIKFINFSGEEDGLIGSQHFVSTVVNGTTPKMDIKLVFNIDEVGGRAGMVNNTITCEYDNGTPTTNNAASMVITQELMTCVSLYSPLNTFLNYAYASDYMPFEDNNEIITGFFEKNETPYRHTANDLLVNMDPTYVYNVAKAATGAMMHFTGASTSPLDTATYMEQHGIRFFPNPTHDFLQFSSGDMTDTAVRFSLVDINGKTVLAQDFATPQEVETVAVSALARGMYLAVIESATTRATQKVVLH
jgi:aminopeptidase YwaD